VTGSLATWQDALWASGTATHREFNVWKDDWTGIDCWIDHRDDSVIVVLDGTGQGDEFLFRLRDLKESLESLSGGRGGD